MVSLVYTLAEVRRTPLLYLHVQCCWPLEGIPYPRAFSLSHSNPSPSDRDLAVVAKPT